MPLRACFGVGILHMRAFIGPFRATWMDVPQQRRKESGRARLAWKKMTPNAVSSLFNRSISNIPDKIVLICRHPGTTNRPSHHESAASIITHPQSSVETIRHTATMAKTNNHACATKQGAQGQAPEQLTPLHYAAWHGHTEAVDQLVRVGADIKARTSEGQTALHLAAMQGHRDCVEYLVRRNGDVDHQDRCGRTALHYAAHNAHGEVIGLLLASGASVEQTDVQDMTALDLAQQTGDARSLQWLLNGVKQ